MKILASLGRYRSVFLFGAVMLLACSARSLRAEDTATPATQPTTQPAQAATTPPAAAPDPLGFDGGPTKPLVTPNSYLPGWPSGAADKNLDIATGGTWKPYAGDKP